MKRNRQFLTLGNVFHGKYGICALCRLFALCCLCISLAGCGKAEDDGDDVMIPDSETADSLNDSGFTDAEISVPAGLVGDEVYGKQAAYTDEDGSHVVYALSGDERGDIVRGLSDELADSIEVILADDDRYPDIEGITANEDYTEFTIALTDGNMNIYESMLAMSFYIAGNKYQIYSGVSADDALTVVRYVDSATGNVVSETDSRSMAVE